GSETATWATTARRVYVRGDYTCEGNLRGSATRLLAISSSGEWLDIRGVRAGGGSVERVLRLRDAGLPGAVPKDVAATLARRRLAIQTARAAAATPLTVEDIIDAARTLDAAVVRSWVVESGQRFDLDARQIGALADAGVPAWVTGVMGMSRAPAAVVAGPDSSAIVQAYLNSHGAVDQYGAPAQPTAPQSMYPPIGCDSFNCLVPGGDSPYNA